MPLDLEENDKRFLAHLHELYGSGNADNKELAQLIAGARHFILDLLPETLNKSGRRYYGPKKNDPKGKIIRYHAFDTPAIFEFGYEWEEACCNYQWAAAFPIAEGQVADFAEKAAEAARYYIQRDGELLEETAEFQTFFQLFNVRLDKIFEPGMLKQAADHISGDVKKKLQFQFEVVAQTIKSRSERLSSNGGDLVNQLSSRRAMSGTPYIAEGLTASLADNVVKDAGAEGKIIDMFVRRDQEGKIHIVELTTIEKLMDQILLNHKRPQRVRGIIETGGLFKVFKDNAKIAEDLMNYLALRQETGHVDRSIEGVLFFSTAPGQDQPDTLYVWRKGAAFPELVGGTTKEHLEAKGLDPTKYFVYYDERHTTGQDIPQIPEAMNLPTFDIKMLRKTLNRV